MVNFVRKTVKKLRASLPPDFRFHKFSVIRRRRSEPPCPGSSTSRATDTVDVFYPSSTHVVAASSSSRASELPAPASNLIQNLALQYPPAESVEDISRASGADIHSTLPPFQANKSGFCTNEHADLPSLASLNLPGYSRSPTLCQIESTSPVKTEKVDTPPLMTRSYASNARHLQPKAHTPHAADHGVVARIVAPAGEGFRAPLQRYGTSRNLQEMNRYSYMSLPSQLAVQRMERRVAVARERLNNEVQNLQQLRNAVLQDELGRNTAAGPPLASIPSDAQAGPSRTAGSLALLSVASTPASSSSSSESKKRARHDDSKPQADSTGATSARRVRRRGEDSTPQARTAREAAPPLPLLRRSSRLNRGDSAGSMPNLPQEPQTQEEECGIRRDQQSGEVQLQGQNNVVQVSDNRTGSPRAVRRTRKKVAPSKGSESKRRRR